LETDVGRKEGAGKGAGESLSNGLGNGDGWSMHGGLGVGVKGSGGKRTFLSQGDANKNQLKERGCIVLYCPLFAIPHYGTMMSCK
jgi:hypothetical protein